MFDNLKLDIKQARKHNAGPGESTWKVLMRPTTFAVVNYRFGRWVHNMPSPLRTGLGVVSTVVRYVTEIVTGVHISPLANIGPGLVVHTPYGVFVGPTVIGSNCVIQHGVVITYGTRRVGDDVYFSPGAKVVGNVTIGNNVLVMPNSVVVVDVPDDSTVVGVPARIRLPRGRTLKTQTGRQYWLRELDQVPANGHRA